MAGAAAAPAERPLWAAGGREPGHERGAAAGPVTNGCVAGAPLLWVQQREMKVCRTSVTTHIGMLA